MRSSEMKGLTGCAREVRERLLTGGEATGENFLEFLSLWGAGKVGNRM